MADCPDHPFATLFPLLEGDAFAALVEDMRAHGQREPITVYEGQILDGRNRARACRALGLPTAARDFGGDDPLAFVISANLMRRHLDESQRAMIAGRLATMRQGRQKSKAPIGAFSQTDAAVLLKVGRLTVQRARAVLDRGAPELIAAVDRGAIPVSVAAQLAALPAAAQRGAAAAPETAAHAAKTHRRAEREAELAGRSLADSLAAGAERYGVIYADPPWRFEPRSRRTGLDRAADNHYPTMTLARLAALKPPAAEDCVLFLWATVPMLSEALAVMHAWGFAYKSAGAWVKPSPGTGYWFRNQLELLLVGTCGEVCAPAMGAQPPQIVTEKPGRHSAKPEAFAVAIETLYPNVPKLEMFARRARKGWTAFGNEL